MTESRFQGWHPHAVEAQLAKEARERKTRRNAWIKTASRRRLAYTQIVSLPTVELIAMVGYLGGGDDYDGCFTREGEVEFAFAKRVLRQRFRALESEVVSARKVTEQLKMANKATEKAINEKFATMAKVVQLKNENENLRDQLAEAHTQIESMWKTIAP